MLKLVIFDCDGVLFDSREANRAYYNHLRQQFGCPVMDEEELDFVHAHNVMDSVAHIFRRYPLIAREAVDRYRTELDYTPFLKYMIMEPDLMEFLRIIKPVYHTAISTNRTTTMPLLLDIFGLRPWFEQVVTALDAPRPKPAPDALRMILDNFGVQVKEAIYVGDSEVDREHTRSVGMKMIAFRNQALDAEYHVDNFMAITRLEPFNGKIS
ncbi:MAG: HAD family hydrolase [Desulfobulbaceae bacterium]|nr:HAD family hydrolase [Desulfobulbaceae bacterium]